MYVCQSVSWLTLLLKLYKYRDISSSVWDIFLKIFGGIPGRFVHLFQLVVNFLYVCQSVSWLTLLLKLHKYRNISSSVWDIFLKIFGGIPGRFVHLFQLVVNFLYVCQSVIWLTSLLKLFKSRDISSSARDIFLKFRRDMPGILAHGFQIIFKFFYVCQSFIWLISSWNYTNIDNSSSGWDNFVKFLWNILETFIHYFQIILIFYVCQSVALLLP